jgi:hypothetical protein
MTLVLNIKQGDIDFIGNFNETVNNGNPIAQVAMTVNPYWYRDHFTGRARDFLSEVIPAMNNGNHDNSDIQSDYFDVGWYIDVNIGQWNKPYALVK